jgi:hypothetical protein
MGVTEAANNLALSVKTCSRWARVARDGTMMSVAPHRVRLVTDFQNEVSYLKPTALPSLSMPNPGYLVPLESTVGANAKLLATGSKEH